MADRPEGDRRIIISRDAIGFFSLLFAATAVVCSILFFSELRAERVVLAAEERQAVSWEEFHISADIGEVLSDLSFLTSASQIAGLFNKDGRIFPDEKRNLEREYRDLAAARGIYDQIRFIDEDGWETVRVNFNDGSPAIVDEAGLQQKRDRYYFSEAFALERGEVFVSPLDLNVEYGAIERPLKPVIRFAGPVFDRVGRKRGVVILNYLAAHILEELGKTSPVAGSSHSMLVNAQGYWLKGQDPEDEWGFAIPERQDRTFPGRYPEAWEKILETQWGQFEDAAGLFTFAAVYPLGRGHWSGSGQGLPAREEAVTPGYWWKVISLVPRPVLRKVWTPLLLRYLLVLAAVGVVHAVGTQVYARGRAARRRAEEELRRHHEELEELVKGRTADLKQTNKQLFTEVTERRRAEVALLEARDELEQRVTERTAELQKLVKGMAGREVRMAEMKKQVRAMEEELERLRRKSGGRTE